MKKLQLNVCVGTSDGFIEESTELSYLDILAKLKEDINSDSCMPKADHDEAEKLIKELFDLLWKYSY